MHRHLSFQSTPSMSFSHSYTAVDNDDDTDICPVCDSRCTCRLELDVNSQPTPPAPPVPSLKIKFTLPLNLIAKRQQVPLTDGGRSPNHALTLAPEKPQKILPKSTKSGKPLKQELLSRKKS